MARINTTQYALLGMLSFQPMSGYDLKKFTDRSISFFWSENYGHIYPVLKKMEEQKLVTKHTMHTEGKPSKNVYSITKKGQTLLSRWLEAPVRKRIFRLEILLKVFFGYRTGIDNIIGKVDAERENAQAVLTELAEIEQHIDSHQHEAEKGRPPYMRLCLNYGKYFYRAVAQWCDETIDILQKERNKEE
jgi:PadR family transcriptional regulator AphA